MGIDFSRLSLEAHCDP